MLGSALGGVRSFESDHRRGDSHILCATSIMGELFSTLYSSININSIRHNHDGQIRRSSYSITIKY